MRLNWMAQDLRPKDQGLTTMEGGGGWLRRTSTKEVGPCSQLLRTRHPYLMSLQHVATHLTSSLAESQSPAILPASHPGRIRAVKACHRLAGWLAGPRRTSSQYSLSKGAMGGTHLPFAVYALRTFQESMGRIRNIFKIKEKILLKKY